MSIDALRDCLIELSAGLREPVRPLMVGGGLGLYLKQQQLQAQTEWEPLISRELWPPARATEDIDLLLRTEIVVSLEHMQSIRQTLDVLGFHPIPECEYLQFAKSTPLGPVKVDLLTSVIPPDLVAQTKRKPPRVRPQGQVRLHAYETPEAIAVDEGATTIYLSGRRSGGKTVSTEIRVPGPLTLLLMKLHAFRDREERGKENPGDQELARHHALDLYRVVAMLSRDEFELVERLIDECQTLEVEQSARVVQTAQDIIFHYFADEGAPGVLRLRTYVREQYRSAIQLEVPKFVSALRDLFQVGR